MPSTSRAMVQILLGPEPNVMVLLTIQKKNQRLQKHVIMHLRQAYFTG